MTDVMPEQQAVELDELVGGRPAGTDSLDAVDEQLIARLVGRSQAGGLQLAGEGGLLAQPTKRLVESDPLTRSIAVAGQAYLVHTVNMRRGKNIVRPLYCDL